MVTAAPREDQILNQLSTRFGVHPLVIGGWKNQALLALPGLFGQKVEREAEAVAARVRTLFEQIGRLEIALFGGGGASEHCSSVSAFVSGQEFPCPAKVFSCGA